MRISYSKNIDAIVKVVGDIWGIEVGSQISGKLTVMKDLNVPSRVSMGMFTSTLEFIPGD